MGRKRSKKFSPLRSPRLCGSVALPAASSASNTHSPISDLHSPISTLRTLLLLIALVAASTACSRQPNVLLITFDTTRADAVGYATSRKGVTPNLDALAADGTWFSNAFTSQPLTMPAHSTIMTGLLPPRHGVRNNGTYVLDRKNLTLAELLRDNGYRTHAVVSSYVLDSQFGLDQGFDSYDDDLSGGPHQKMFMFREIRGNQTASKAIDWLKSKRSPDKPFFLWVHFFDPHADYEAPEPIAAKFPGEQYLAEVSFADRELGRVLGTLDELGLKKNTLVVMTSDHGESLGDHGEKTHGIFVYDGTTHVPLLFSGKGAPRRGKVDALVRTADIAPTLAEMLGLKMPAGDGSSMLALMKGESEPARMAYSESLAPQLNFGWAPLRAHRTLETKYIEAPRRELFDLRKDPGENRNLWDAASVPSSARPLVASLRKIEAADPFTHGRQTEAKLDPEARRKLAALGYVWGNERPASGPRPDPKDRIVVWERFQEAQAAVRRREYVPALAMIRSVLAVDRDNVVAMSSMANVLTKMNARTEALEIYKRMIEIDPARDTPYLGASKVYRELGRYAEAEAIALAVTRLQPDNPDGFAAVADVYLDQGKYAEAETWFRKSLAIDPNSSVSISGLGNCLNRAGRLREALAVLRKGREHDPTSQAILYNLAVVVERLGDRDGAKRLYEETLKVDAEHSMAWNNLGAIYDRMGKPQEAIRCIANARRADPANVEAAYNLGVMLMRAKRPAEAIPHLEDVLRMNPQFVAAALQRARALTILDRKEAAITAWKQLAPGNPAAWLQVARIQLAQGRQVEAAASLRLGIEKGGERVKEAAAQDEKLRSLLQSNNRT